MDSRLMRCVWVVGSSVTGRAASALGTGLLLVALTTAGCGATGASTRADEAPSGADGVVGQAADFAGDHLDGAGAFQLASLQGKVVIVDFWASWCEPCRAAMPFYEDLYSRYREQGLEVVGVSVDETRELALGFLEDLPVSFIVIWDAGHGLAERFDLQTMPTSLLIDRAGVIRAVHDGFFEDTGAETETLVQTLLAEGARSGGSGDPVVLRVAEGAE